MEQEARKRKKWKYRYIRQNGTERKGRERRKAKEEKKKGNKRIGEGSQVKNMRNG